jgi:hypothetical protein
MTEWLFNNPVIFGLITFVLMLIDWWLTIAQEKERKEHYLKHYQSYPTNSIEGSPSASLQRGVKKQQLINLKHLITSLIATIVLSVVLIFIPLRYCALYIGFVWGSYLIVCTQHLTNLTGYIASRKGLHGKLFLHQRTGYLIQFGRYFSFAVFLLLLSILSGSEIILGITIAGFTSAIRQLIWLKKVPKINQNDIHPVLDNIQDLK